ncbi:hypothetical protein [Streptomyces colonosanans]|uniref:Uncharacterized protein n=1 Tax=Streptomyces colonosanans TaxID=1428652 RepID=A0A1S2PEM6_9ACTN|nr:hypothetical protein [Streptomyces colonosanans]OIJ92032.1 hypothetical protein BIV24_14835 [Streptomyces colonosanans]
MRTPDGACQASKRAAQIFVVGAPQAITAGGTSVDPIVARSIPGAPKVAVPERAALPAVS